MNYRLISKLAPWLGLIGLCFWVFASVNYINGSPLFLANNGASNLPTEIAFSAFGYVTLLLGVFLGAVYNRIKAERTAGTTQINIGATIGQAIQTPDFWLGIFASPVVYVILLQAVDLDNVSPGKVFALTLVGLQNGFVCNTIADSLIGGGTVRRGR